MRILKVFYGQPEWSGSTIPLPRMQVSMSLPNVSDQYYSGSYMKRSDEFCKLLEDAEKILHLILIYAARLSSRLTVPFTPLQIQPNTHHEKSKLRRHSHDATAISRD